MYTRDREFLGRKVDLLGERFGRLVVIKLVGSKHFQRFWLCQCDCGNITEVKTSSLTRRKRPTKSCGCAQRDSAKTSVKAAHKAWVLPKGEAARNKLYYTYKRNAGMRSLLFSLSIEEFTVLTSSNCYYCGTPPAMNAAYHLHVNGDYFYNGLDRIDNEIGYLSDNVVPCCKHCNLAKHTLGRDEFIEWVDRVYNHMHSIRQ